MAAVKSDLEVQGHSQLESGSMSLHPLGHLGTFFGIYDGHGGPNASGFIQNHLFEIVKRFVSDIGEMCNALDSSFFQLDQQYLQLVKNESEAKLGCLVGIVVRGHLYVANAGDSKAVLGRLARPKRHVPLVLERWFRHIRHVQAIPLPTDQYPIMATLQEEIETLHPRDHIIFIPTTRSVGDSYLNNKPNKLYAPTIVEYELVPEDEFIIFASPWLWKHLSNEAAVDMVKNSSRNGIAAKLIKKALEIGAWNDHRLTYKELKKLNITERRSIHEDISVVVLFLDHELIIDSKCCHFSAISFEEQQPAPVVMEVAASSPIPSADSHENTRLELKLD